MDKKEVLAKVKEIIRDVFDNDDIVVMESTVADDVEGWDSLMHITLMGTIEDEFDIKFAMKDVIGMKNVGDMVDIIMSLID